MKVRARLQNSSKTVDLGDSNANENTFAILKDKIREEFGLIGSFELSLNKKDILVGEDDACLSDFSLVSGDLIHILQPDVVRPDPAPLLLSAQVHDGQYQMSHSQSDQTMDNDSHVEVSSGASTSSMNMDCTGQCTNVGEDTNSGSSDYQPQWNGSAEYQLQGNGSAEYQLQGNGSAEYQQQGNGSAEYHPQGNGSAEYHPQGNGSAEYHPQGNGSAEYHPQGNGSAEYQLQGNESAEYQLQGNGSTEYQQPVNDPIVNRCLREPLQCCEATDSAVPTLLSNLYISTTLQDDNDRLWVVIHALMLESGLQPLHVLSNASNGSSSETMPDSWRQSSCFNIKYRLPESEDVTCSVTGVVMGPFCVLHGSLVGQSGEVTNTECQVMVKSSDHVTSDTNNEVASSYKNLKILSRNVKNKLCLPLIQEMRTALGYPDGNTLISLTHEVKLKILSYLDCGSLLRIDATCQHLHSLAHDNAVWRRRYLLDYGSRVNNSLSQNWYGVSHSSRTVRAVLNSEVVQTAQKKYSDITTSKATLCCHLACARHFYKLQYKTHKDHIKTLRARFLTPGQMWTRPRFHPPFAPMTPYTGGIVGGDYDLAPHFPGIPDFTRHVRSPLQPMRPRFDPFGTLPNHNVYGPGAGRRSRGGWMGGFGGMPRFF